MKYPITKNGWHLVRRLTVLAIVLYILIPNLYTRIQRLIEIVKRTYDKAVRKEEAIKEFYLLVGELRDVIDTIPTEHFHNTSSFGTQLLEIVNDMDRILDGVK